MDTFKRAIENDKFAQHTGIELVTISPGYALTRIKIEDKHLNGLGFVQGGVIFTLADVAFAAAANEAGIPTLGINTTISYIKAPRGKLITAEARVVSATKKLCTYDVTVRDEDGDLAAKMLTTGYMK